MRNTHKFAVSVIRICVYTVYKYIYIVLHTLAYIALWFCAVSRDAERDWVSAQISYIFMRTIYKVKDADDDEGCARARFNSGFPDCVNVTRTPHNHKKKTTHSQIMIYTRIYASSFFWVFIARGARVFAQHNPCVDAYKEAFYIYKAGKMYKDKRCFAHLSFPQSIL